MIPDSVETVVAFLLLIAPGYVWQTRAARYLPTPATTTLREATRIVFSSIIPSVLAATIVLTALGGWPLSVPTDLSMLHALMVGLATSALACLFAYFWSFLWFRRERRWASQISDGSTLFKALTEQPENTGVARVIVTARLQDGTVWRGDHRAHDVESEESFRTLWLAPSLSHRDGATGKVTDSEFGDADHVVIPLDQIRSLQVRYVSTPHRSRAAPRSDESASLPQQGPRPRRVEP